MSEEKTPSKKVSPSAKKKEPSFTKKTDASAPASNPVLPPEDKPTSPYFAKFSGLCFLPIATSVAVLFGISFFLSLLIAHTLGGFETLSMPQDYIFNVVFDFLILLASIGLFLDLLYRHQVSHIAGVLVLALLVNVYCLYYGIYDVVIHKPVGSVFFFLCFLASVGADVFYVKKALGGDANLPFWACSIATWALFVFASVANYTFFDTYAFVNGAYWNYIPKDFYFWGNLLTMRTILLCSIAASTISLQCDFDPKPLKLNDLGQVIYEDSAKSK
jgi:hypothetical protein